MLQDDLSPEAAYLTPGDMIGLVLKEFFDADLVDAVMLDYQDAFVTETTLQAIVADCRLWSGD